MEGIQETQQMVGVSGIGILGLVFVIVIILIVIGYREKEDILRKVRFIRVGGVLLGLLVIVTGFAWYGYLVTSTSVHMAFEDVILLTTVSSIGGLISGISYCIPIDQ